MDERLAGFSSCRHASVVFFDGSHTNSMKTDERPGGFAPCHHASVVFFDVSKDERGLFLSSPVVGILLSFSTDRRKTKED